MRRVSRIRVFYPNFFSNRLIAYVALRLGRHFNDNEVTADVMGISSDRSVDADRLLHYERSGADGDSGPEVRQLYVDAIPSWAWPVARRLLSDVARIRFAEYRFRQRLAANDIAYLFPGCSVSLYRRAKLLGCTVVTERINTLRAYAKAILDAEYERMRLPPTHGILESAAADELEKLQLVDYVFCPSPLVAESLVQAGIPDSRLLSVSYGLDPRDILDVHEKDYLAGPVRAVFVGRIGFRKGVHLLLDAWKEAGVAGKLILVGNVDPDFRQYLQTHMDRATTEHIPFVDDLGPILRSSDFFVLPSLEEGSPLVTYLALGASLPMIVSQMGAGGVVEHGREALVIDPHDRRQFADALGALASAPGRRAVMSAASGQTARHFTWEQVAARRKEMLLRRLEDRG